MDWIHCNNCYIQPTAGKSFSLTSCGHMFCCDCIQNDADKETCNKCKSTCRSIELSADMKPEVQEFFAEPDEMLSKLTRLLSFQKEHRMRLTTHWINLNRKYRESKEESKKLTMVAQKMYADIKALQKQNKFLKSTLQSVTQNDKYSQNTNPRSAVLGMSTPINRNNNSSAKAGLSQVYHGSQASGQQVYRSTLVTPLRVRNPYQSNTPGGMTHVSRGSASGRMDPPTFVTPRSTKKVNTPGSGYYSASPEHDCHNS